MTGPMVHQPSLTARLRHELSCRFVVPIRILNDEVAESLFEGQLDSFQFDLLTDWTHKIAAARFGVALPG